MPRTNTTIQAFLAAMSFKTRTEPHLINKYRIRRIHILSRVKMTIKSNRSIHPRKGHCLQSNHLIKTLEICNTTKKMLNLQVFFKIFQWMWTPRSFKKIKILKAAILRALILDNSCIFNINHRIWVKTLIRINKLLN